MAAPRYSELPLSAQTAYAELAERTRAFEMNSALAGLSGSFHTLKRKGRAYWYFSYREASARAQSRDTPRCSSSHPKRIYRGCGEAEPGAGGTPEMDIHPGSSLS